MKLGRLFISSSIGSITSAAFSLLATIAIVRWYGDSVFTDYIIDLAYLALLGIFIELIPSNFSVFKLQENPNFIKALSLFTVLMVAISFAITATTLELIPLFKSDTYWIVVYSSVLALKKYLDIRLQSLGRMKEFFIIEAFIAGSRLILLAVSFNLNLPPSIGVWGSLVIATITIYSVWILFNKDELKIFIQCISYQNWLEILRYKNVYPDYYVGIGLKRIRDNIISVAAPFILLNKQDLATFFLAYRGLSFALGQIKIIEAILNFKKALEIAKSIRTLHMLLIALGAQLLCILAIMIVTYSSGLPFDNWNTTLVLSLVCWVYVFYSRVRAAALSKYQQKSLNISSFSYITLISILLGALMFLDTTSSTIFSAVILISELISVIVLILINKGK